MVNDSLLLWQEQARKKAEADENNKLVNEIGRRKCYEDDIEGKIVRLTCSC